MPYRPNPDGKGGAWELRDDADAREKRRVERLALLGWLVLEKERHPQYWSLHDRIEALKRELIDVPLENGHH